MAFFSPSSDYQIHYEVIPNHLPKTTFFVHGNLASNAWWTPVQEVWKKRGSGQKWTGSMIMAEFRGCGLSTAPKSLADVNMQQFAKDFLALIEDQKLGPVNLVGHSTGGLICGLMAAIRPDLVSNLVLLDPVGAKGVQFDESMLGAFQAMKGDEALTATVIGSTIHKNNPNLPLFKNHIAKDAFRAVQSVGPWVLQSLKGFDGTEQLKSVRNPTLVFHGEHDSLLPIADSMELALLMSGDFQILKGCGHCANIESPELLVEMSHQFLFQ